MKKVFFYSFMFVCVFGYSQKKLTIYNLTTYQIKIYNIVTKPTVGTYPWCQNGSYALGGIGLFPGDSYIVENTTNISRFPFYSPATVNPITSWKVKNSAAPPTNTLSQTLWNNNTVSSNQIFNYVFYSVGGSPGSNYNGYMGRPGPLVGVNPYTNAIQGWTVEYAHVDYSPTNSEDTIVFY